VLAQLGHAQRADTAAATAIAIGAPARTGPLALAARPVPPSDEKMRTAKEKVGDVRRQAVGAHRLVADHDAE